VKQERDHPPEIVAGSEPTDQPLARRPGFGEGQAECPTDLVPENQGFSGNRSHWVSVCHVTSPLGRIPAGWTAAACPRQMNISGLNPSGKSR
jgi:hypothetical protein